MNDKQAKWLMRLATLSTLALILMAIANIATAVDWLNRSSSTPSFSEQCDTLLEQGEYKALEEFVSKQLQDHPKDPTALAYLAFAAYGQDDLPRAKGIISEMTYKMPWMESKIRRLQELIVLREEEQSTKQ